MIVYAPNVHTGGGKVLLDELLANSTFGQVQGLFCDDRYKLPQGIQNTFPVFRIKPTIFNRLTAEFKLKNFLKTLPAQPTLFFGNLPPIFFKPVHGILYLQNCFLLPSVPIETSSAKTYLRLFIEKLLLNKFLRNVTEVWVQTDWMMRETKKFKPDVKVVKKPFLPTMPPSMGTHKTYDVITVTSYSKHKRFDLFLNALEILDPLLQRPIRVIAILDSANTLQNFASLRFKNITLEFNNSVSRDQLFEYYQKSKVSIITSSMESFSLPVYESLHFGLSVIGPDKPFMEDVKERVDLFSNDSAHSLAMTILSKINTQNS